MCFLKRLRGSWSSGSRGGHDQGRRVPAQPGSAALSRHDTRGEYLSIHGHTYTYCMLYLQRVHCITLHCLLQEADGDPTLIVVLSDEAMLGQVLQVIPNPIPPLPRPPPRDPHTAALRKWFLDLVFQRTAPPAAVLQPNLEPNPPMVSKVLRR